MSKGNRTSLCVFATDNSQSSAPNAVSIENSKRELPNRVLLGIKLKF